MLVSCEAAQIAAPLVEGRITYGNLSLPERTPTDGDARMGPCQSADKHDTSSAVNAGGQLSDAPGARALLVAVGHAWGRSTAQPRGSKNAWARTVSHAKVRLTGFMRELAGTDGAQGRPRMPSMGAALGRNTRTPRTVPKALAEHLRNVYRVRGLFLESRFRHLVSEAGAARC